MATESHRLDPWTAVVGACLLLLLAAVAWPLGELAHQSLVGQVSGRVGLENFTTFFGSGYYTRALMNSLVVSAGATVLALMLGIPLAVVFTRFQFLGRGLLRVLVLMSMMSPPFIGAYAWIVLFGRSGLVTEWGTSVGLSLPTIYGPGGIILASALSLYPIVFLVMSSALSRLDGSLEEAASSLGRRPHQIFWEVTLPLMRPAMVTAAMLVFLGVMADFGLPSILGEGERYPVLATLAYSLYLSEIGAEPGMAATTSVILVLVAFMAVGLGRWATQRVQVGHDGGRPLAVRPLTGRWSRVWVGFAILTVSLANLPLLVVIASSFMEVRGAMFLPVFTTENYVQAWLMMGNALTNSLQFAGLALAMATVLGALVGYAVSRRHDGLTRIVDLLVMVPFVVPGTVLGIGYAQVFNTPPLLLTGTSAILVMVLLVRRLPYVVRSSASIVAQIDKSLEEASSSLGEPPMKGFLRVMVPLMRPGILAGVVIAWLEIFNELSATIVLYTGSTRTLPIAAFQQAVGGDFGLAAAYSGMLIGVTAISLGFALWLGREDQQTMGLVGRG
jgi:iron(III) transport system permease protein